MCVQILQELEIKNQSSINQSLPNVGVKCGREHLEVCVNKKFRNPYCIGVLLSNTNFARDCI